MSQTEFSGALEAILQRDVFYYENYRKNLLYFFVLIFIVILLIFFNVISYQAKPRPIYFATTSSEEILQLTPVTEKNISDAELIPWVTAALETCYNYNFVNYRQAFQNARPYFTVKGYENFLNDVKQSLNLNRIKKEKLLFSATISDVVIQDQGHLGSGTYYWDVSIPMKVALLGGVQTKYEGYNWVVFIKIIRVNPLQNPSGLGIAQMIVRES